MPPVARDVQAVPPSRVKRKSNPHAPRETRGKSHRVKRGVNRRFTLYKLFTNPLEQHRLFYGGAVRFLIIKVSPAFSKAVG